MRLINQILAYAGTVTAACNGHDELCDRKYSEVTFVGSHNSPFNGVLPVHNQELYVTEQLDLGARFLQAQTQEKEGDIQLCHTNCRQLDVGPLVEYLADVEIWMDDNPEEVVTLLLTNRDGIPVPRFDQVFESTGLKDLAFHPNGTVAKDSWPTLRELIDDETRLIVFMVDYNHDQGEIDYMLDEFAHFWETPDGITDSNFPTCAVDRPTGGDTRELMGIMNHMLNKEVAGMVFADMDSAKDTNSRGSIQKQVDRCAEEHSVQPNIILVSTYVVEANWRPELTHLQLDWIDTGDAFDVQLSLNGL